jgi:hemerythrin-like metal-binding protein
MAFFEWDDQLKTGIAQIDDQHKGLIGAVNELYEAMRKKTTKEIMQRILDDLGEYTRSHFKFEEAAFEKYGYPLGDEHKKYHSDLVDQLGVLIGKFENNELGISIEVLDFLINWVKTHIKVQDMKYVPFLKDKEL